MRINSSKKSEELMNELTRLYGFSSDAIICRTAVCLTLQQNKKFDLNIVPLDRKGKDFLSETNLFGSVLNKGSYLPIYLAMFDQHYQTNLSEDQFRSLFNHHLQAGLVTISNEIKNNNISSGYHVSYLMKLVKKGLELINESNPFIKQTNSQINIKSYESVIEISLGKDEKNQDIKLRINDLNEFDSCNIAIAGMVGSGKTELVKDILYQIATQSKNELKFIFFDYKGEGNPERLRSFFDSTCCNMVDLKRGPMELNPLGFVSISDKRTQEFNIKSFVDFICTIATQLGSKQKHILQTVISESFDQLQELKFDSTNKNTIAPPTMSDIFNSLKVYYESNGIAPDTLYGIMSDLATNIFSDEPNTNYKKIYEQSLYINLPIELSDTLRQLCVFLTLKYLLAEFSSTNDTEPTSDRIKPLRYVIVVDEAHVYLKNKNASKALEDILRVLRSKGVVVIMLTQGVEDYKTKNFDFSSQIKIPICLNINNKDYKLIESFVGTPRSKQKLQEAIGKLEPQKGITNIVEPQIIKINQFWKSITNKL
jgi:DNA sulfur modification protein DndE